MFGLGKNKEKKSDVLVRMLAEKHDAFTDRINSKGSDMDKATLVWLCRAFAGIALIIGLGYIIYAVVVLANF